MPELLLAVPAGVGILRRSESGAANVTPNFARSPVFRILCKKMAPAPILSVLSEMKIGIFLPNWLGDLVMATPALRALRRRFGRQARMIGIMRPNLGELLAGTDWLDQQWYFHPGSGRRELGNRSLLDRMRRERFDVVLMLTNSLRPALLAWLAGARERVGYVRSGRGPLLTGKVYPQRNGRRIAPAPMVDYYLALTEAVGCPAESPRLELALTDADRQAADVVWHNLGLRQDGRVVTLNSSGAYGSAKLWPPEHFAELARRIVDSADHDVLIVCGPAEREIGRDIVRRADRPRVFSLADQELGLPTSKGCIERSRLMVSTDSGPRHMGAALGKPVITLLGPTLPVWIDNPTVEGVNMQLDLDCSGCAKRTCPLGHHKCMQDLSAQSVYREVARLIEQNQSDRAA